MNVGVKSDSSNHSNKRISRRTFIAIIIGVVICFYLFYPSKPSVFKTKKKIVILGFDGTDPGLVERWLDELPHLRKLKSMGGYSKLQTTTPPESPVAWSSFAVGANPGKHGVFDFIQRPSGTYTPSIESFVKREYPELMFKTSPVTLPKAISRRGGTAFWDVLSDAGVRTTLIEVPITFPPPKLNYGRSLSGLGVPDIRGMQATFHHFVYGVGENSRESGAIAGGKIEALQKDGETYSAFIWGPNDPVIEQEKQIKEKELLELRLSEYEWEAHLLSKQGSHAPEESKLVLSEYLNMDVYGNMAYKDYLNDEKIKRRADRIRQFLSSGNDYKKEAGASASDARENRAKIRQLKDKIQSEIGAMNKPIKVEVSFKIVNSSQVEITVGNETQTVGLHQWSGWFTVYFSITKLIKVQAICRFYPQELTANSIKIYMTSPDIDPRNPALPVSYPEDYSKELAEWLKQPYKTRGWASETHGMKDGALSEDGFISDLNFIMDLREDKLFETWDRTLNNVFVSVFSATDRVAHMFYHFLDKEHPMYDPVKAEKYEDTIKNIYKRMDEIVGKMMEKIDNDPDTTLIVMSDHGFASWRYQVHINNWLIENGFMTLTGQTDGMDVKQFDLSAVKTDFFSYVDWRRTKAYAMGLGQIYINLQDREPIGAVKPDEYEAVCDEIITKLEQLRDTREGITPFISIEDDPHKELGGLPVVHHVKKRAEIWQGAYGNDEHDCPDLQISLYPGYRVSWDTCLGGISSVKDEATGNITLGGVFENNMETWSGDHCSISADYLPGMVFCNRPIRQNPSIYDFAPTVLEYFGLKVPKEMEGKNLLDT